MRWDRSHESSDVDDRRSAGGGAGGGGIPFGLLAMAGRFGWKGILIAIVLIGAMTYGGGTCANRGERSGSQVMERGAASDDELARFAGFVLDDAQDMWTRELSGYKRARLVLFRDSVGSACGTASAAVGPFYCPLDHKVYVDLSFYDELRRRFGAAGDFAQAYVIAHELGHHVQNLRGKLGRGEVASIEVELQADCLAGAWGRDAAKRKLLEDGDVEEALAAAAAVGDDNIQKKTQGRIQPETWTHGSSAQRSAAYRRGFDGGAPACKI
jgi:predicted metalloprotease